MPPTKFLPNNKDHTVEIDLFGKVYPLNVSPTNHGYIKQCVALQAEGKTILTSDMANASTLAEVDELFARLAEKQRQLIEIILPGEWDNLWNSCRQDVLTMTELILFVVNELRSGAGRAMVAQAAPRRPEGEEI